MENKISPSKSGLVYGVLFGVLMILEFVTVYVIGMQSLADTSTGVIINMANYLVLPIIFIYLGCLNYKNKINGGYISLVESLKVGISITFVAALVYATFSVIFNLIFPEFIDEMISLSRNAMIKQNPNVSEAELEMGLSMMKKFMNPYIVFPATLAMYSFMGLIYSLIIGAIVKKESPNAQF